MAHHRLVHFVLPVSVTASFENSESESGGCFRRERRLGLDVTWEVLGNEPPVFVRVMRQKVSPCILAFQIRAKKIYRKLTDTRLRPQRRTRRRSRARTVRLRGTRNPIRAPCLVSERTAGRNGNPKKNKTCLFRLLCV